MRRSASRLRRRSSRSVSDDVRAYHRRVFRPDLTTIVVIGRIAPEEARAVIERSFGAWTAGGPKPETDLPPVPPSGPARLEVPDATRVQDDVRLAETIGVTRSSPDYYALDLGNHVLAAPSTRRASTATCGSVAASSITSARRSR